MFALAAVILSCTLVPAQPDSFTVERLSFPDCSDDSSYKLLFIQPLEIDTSGCSAKDVISLFQASVLSRTDMMGLNESIRFMIEEMPYIGIYPQDVTRIITDQLLLARGLEDGGAKRILEAILCFCRQHVGYEHYLEARILSQCIAEITGFFGEEFYEQEMSIEDVFLITRLLSMTQSLETVRRKMRAPPIEAGGTHSLEHADKVMLSLFLMEIERGLHREDNELFSFAKGKVPDHLMGLACSQHGALVGLEEQMRAACNAESLEKTLRYCDAYTLSCFMEKHLGADIPFGIVDIANAAINIGRVDLVVAVAQNMLHITGRIQYPESSVRKIFYSSTEIAESLQSPFLSRVCAMVLRMRLIRAEYEGAMIFSGAPAISSKCLEDVYASDNEGLAGYVAMHVSVCEQLSGKMLDIRNQAMRSCIAVPQYRNIVYYLILADQSLWMDTIRLYSNGAARL